ncbi:single-stranded DNA-binding protein [Lentimicrobium sp.]|jgi:single-strand DNA-binding protein|uniref:single-stranded DNA-binding protein n=1 Tax=Lentimicrobium sp. TaxID=2034841 RepID=UPI0025FCD581|nr:single-stranded DNA-binding protein [Lentimicrobium sp.]MCO5257454.1 single-stranded DNA-binding protein [Lentimicrobium sp.]MCO5262589.1 single-stranded DNA-binding protein [Lentimicrobium sp.]HOP12534.1 single-stranded DNA-binding protein [Lentimicrobium sp.]HPF65299.1 single-stranded DNA-binding protein [Lentimicrobium sp.]HPJ62735.1 single-stranded DNA-binding protein [Lentimicrobium sp.]
MNNLNNTVQLIGRLGADPEVRTLKGDRRYARLRLATSDTYYNKAGEKVQETQWHNLVAWGGLADVCANHLSKGQEIAVEGKLGYRIYTDKDNNKQFITEVTIHDLLMISSRKAG